MEKPQVWPKRKSDLLKVKNKIIAQDIRYHQASENNQYVSWRQNLLQIKIASQNNERFALRVNYLALRESLLKKKHTPSIEIKKTELAHPLKSTLQEAYAFAGMQTIFTFHSQPVTRIKFAHEDKDLLGVASLDGIISICHAFYQPQRIRTLQGHEAGVLDFDWSMSNEIIISTGLDSNILVWDVRNGKCIRRITEDSICDSILFYPHNNNLFFVANRKGYLIIYNLSTGKSIKRLLLSAPLQSLEFNYNGSIIFVGDKNGAVHVIEYVSESFSLRLLIKQNITKKPITSIQYKVWLTNKEISPLLLVSSCDSHLRLISVNKDVKTKVIRLLLQRQIKCQITKDPIRSSFCPLISQREGACLVTGAEDGNVYLFKRENGVCINTLLGHSGSVLDVSWNYDESLLASADKTGVVIIWKRSSDAT